MKSFDLLRSPLKGSGALPTVPPPFDCIWGEVPVVGTVTLATGWLIVCGACKVTGGMFMGICRPEAAAMYIC
jgi:hypothetical protein